MIYASGFIVTTTCLLLVSFTEIPNENKITKQSILSIAYAINEPLLFGQRQLNGFQVDSE